jgi:hypothetical protein
LSAAIFGCHQSSLDERRRQAARHRNSIHPRGEVRLAALFEIAEGR